MKKIGILTSGGDCQGLNAAIRGVAKGLYEEIDDVEIYGIQNGYAGLIHGDYKKMNQSDFSGILTIGGTILGTSRQPFKMMRVIEDENSIDKVAAMKDNYKKMGLTVLLSWAVTVHIKRLIYFLKKVLMWLQCQRRLTMTFGVRK